MVAGLLIRWWSAVRASLAMVVDLSLVHRSCIAHASARLVVGVSLVCRWCVTDLSVCVPLARRCPIAVHSHWSVAHPSSRASVRPLLVRLFE